MTLTSVPSGSVVAAFDGSHHADRALAWAADQAVLEGRALDLVHVVGSTEAQLASWVSVPGSDLVQAQLAAAGRVLEGRAAELRQAHPGLTVRCLVVEGDPRDQLVRLSEKAHLLVLGSHGRGVVGSLLLGSVGVAVSRLASCPVVVTRPSRLSGGRTAGVVVGADGTPGSLPVLEAAFRCASFRGLPLTVAHGYWRVGRDLDGAVDPRTTTVTGLKDDLDAELAAVTLAESVAGLAEKFPDVPVTRRLRHGLADLAVSETEHPWDLVVVGRRHRSTWDRLVSGSVSTAVLERADSPVLVVPEPGSPPR